MTVEHELPTLFDVDIRPYAAETVLALRGELDLCTQPSFVAALAEVADSRTDVVLDLSALTFIDAGNIGLILRARDRAKDRGVDVVLRDPNPLLFRILELTGLHPSAKYEIAS